MDERLKAALARIGCREKPLMEWHERRQGERPLAQTELGERDVLMEGPVVDSEMDEILRSWGYQSQVSPEALRQRLNDLGAGPVTLRIDSPGGDVFAAGNIVSILKSRADPVTAVVMGMAASAAGYIFINADERRMGDKLSSVMLHQAWSIVIGNATDFREQADVLDRIDAVQVERLVEVSGLDADEAKAAVEAETWWIGQEAIDAGLAAAYDSGEKDDRPGGAIQRSPEMHRRALAMIRGRLL